MSLCVCWDNCHNSLNKDDDCEKVMSEYLSSVDFASRLCRFYEDMLVKYKYRKILSVTLINWVKAEDYFFSEILSLFFWCVNFNSSIQVLNDSDTFWTSNLIKREVQQRVKNCLFSDRNVMDMLVNVCREVWELYSTDLFINVAVKIHALYIYKI